MTYQTSRSNVLLKSIKWENNGNFDFLKNNENKVIILNGYVKPNETLYINKFQRSRLTVDLSAKVAHIGIPSIYLNIAFSETTRPVELKFHMNTQGEYIYNKF